MIDASTGVLAQLWGRDHLTHPERVVALQQAAMHYGSSARQRYEWHMSKAFDDPSDLIETLLYQEAAGLLSRAARALLIVGDDC